MPEPRATTRSNSNDTITLRDLLEERTEQLKTLIEERRAQSEQSRREQEKYFNTRLGLVRQQFAANDKALDVAAKEAEKQYKSLNDLRNTCLPRPEYNVEHTALAARVVRLEHEQTLQEGKASMKAVIVAGMIGGLGLVVAIIDICLRVLAH